MNIVGMSEACESLADKTPHNNTVHNTTMQHRTKPHQPASLTHAYDGKEQAMQFRIGDRVRVMIPPGEQQNAGAVRQFHGKVTVIKTTKHVYNGKCSFGNTYELVGCKSDYGTPYTFPEEWLIPLGEGDEE